MDTDSTYISIREAARRLGVHEQAPTAKRGFTLEELADSGIFESDEEVEAFLAMTYAERARDR